MGDDKESTDTNQNVSNLDRRINDLNDHSADVTAELDKLLGKTLDFRCGNLLIIHLFFLHTVSHLNPNNGKQLRYRPMIAKRTL